MRALARHQCVRDQGTARVTTLVGDLVGSRSVWAAWMQLAGRPRTAGDLVEEPRRASATWLTTAATDALARATAAPREPLAIAVSVATWQAWDAARGARVRAFLTEGLVEVVVPATPTVPPRPRAPRPAARHAQARSLAELTMLEALEATPATAGRFALNQPVSMVFGAQAAEVDLLSRADELVIEVDGYHHFTDPERYRRDRRKDALLQAHGYTVMRFLADDVLADAAAAVRAVVEVLGVRRGRAHRSRRKA
ncbi:MAG: DUF559 domain-containing protein [Kofleriaceae bacterium]